MKFFVVAKKNGSKCDNGEVGKLVNPSDSKSDLP